MTKLLTTLLFVFLLVACGKPIVDHTQAEEITLKDRIHLELTKTHIRPIRNYHIARRHLFGELHYNNGIVTDVYCGQEHDADSGVGNGRIPNPDFLNCEHTWPQSKFGSGEKDIKKSDLHHLFPAAPHANSARGNHEFGELRNAYNVCGNSYKGTLQGANRAGFEPPDEHKGNVARALFYFSVRYRMPIDPLQESFLRKWHVEDPVDKSELLRNKRIMEIQGNSNIFITNPSLVHRIQDF